MARHDENCCCNSCAGKRYTRNAERAADEMAEDRDRRDGRSRGNHGGPPIAKNPANQEFINEQWRKAQEEKRRKRRDRKRRLAEGVISSTMLVGGIVAEPPVEGVLEAGDAYEQSRQSRFDRRDEYLDEQTRSSNDRKGGSSKRR